MPKIVRTEKEARAWIRTLIRKGATQIPPDYISVKGHCVGLVGRAFTNGPAGYYDAHALIDAVRKAGKLKVGKPPVGAVVLWRGGQHGHAAVAATRDRILTVDLPRSNKVGRVKRDRVRSQWGYRYVGWVHADDIPGWR